MLSCSLTDSTFKASLLMAEQDSTCRVEGERSRLLVHI
uniref:Uncharacterized protein n=1 Tax=Anguilla anguilla TaxID=7936 RepID=A0A0E9V1U9_ANGAN